MIFDKFSVGIAPRPQYWGGAMVPFPRSHPKGSPRLQVLRAPQYLNPALPTTVVRPTERTRRPWTTVISRLTASSACPRHSPPSTSSAPLHSHCWLVKMVPYAFYLFVCLCCFRILLHCVKRETLLLLLLAVISKWLYKNIPLSVLCLISIVVINVYNRVRTILALGYWVLPNIFPNWVVLGIGQYFYWLSYPLPILLGHAWIPVASRWLQGNWERG